MLDLCLSNIRLSYFNKFVTTMYLRNQKKIDKIQEKLHKLYMSFTQVPPTTATQPHRL